MMNNGKICVSVCAETADALIDQIKRADELADVIEIRFDCLLKDELAKFIKDLPKVKLVTAKPLMATLRHKWNGRDFEPNHQDTLFLWSEFLYHNIFDYADFEGSLQGTVNDALTREKRIFSDFSDAFVEKLKRLQIVFSYHDFTTTSEKDVSYHFMFPLLNYRPAIIKIATQGNDITDGIYYFKLLEQFGREVKFIPILMGEPGKWTRILGLAHGAYMTYASLDTGSETAPGQVSARDLIDIYRARELDETTGIYGILGSNTSVSMSPYIHNTAFKYHGLNSVFVPLQVSDLDEFMRRMVTDETREIKLNFKGFSVTLPHKQAIIKHLDYLDETAAKIGAVNTVKITDGKLHGYNTDAPGFIEPLVNSYGDLTDARVAVLGAGGAARACVYALQTAGARVTIFARDLPKAKSLAEDFRVELQALGTRHSALGTYEDFDILVNTTPLGMKGKAEGETPAVAEQLKGLRLVYDLVYVPFQTPLMTEADKAGVPKIGGLAMLVAQAAEQQKIWTGMDAPVEEMSRAALKKLS